MKDLLEIVLKDYKDLLEIQGLLDLIILVREKWVLKAPLEIRVLLALVLQLKGLKDPLGLREMLVWVEDKETQEIKELQELQERQDPRDLLLDYMLITYQVLLVLL
jgi:hypothetical protein